VSLRLVKPIPPEPVFPKLAKRLVFPLIAVTGGKSRMAVVGRVHRRINVERELYLLTLDTAKERGICPDPSNDNAALYT